MRRFASERICSAYVLANISGISLGGIAIKSVILSIRFSAHRAALNVFSTKSKRYFHPCAYNGPPHLIKLSDLDLFAYGQKMGGE